MRDTFILYYYCYLVGQHGIPFNVAAATLLSTLVHGHRYKGSKVTALCRYQRHRPKQSWFISQHHTRLHSLREHDRTYFAVKHGDHRSNIQA